MKGVCIILIHGKKASYKQVAAEDPAFKNNVWMCKCTHVWKILWKIIYKIFQVDRMGCWVIYNLFFYTFH